MDIFEGIRSLYQFLQDKSKHIVLRISVPLIVTLVVFIVNDLTGFSRGYIINRKLAQFQELMKIEPEIMKTDTLFVHKYRKIKLDMLNDNSFVWDSWNSMRTSHFLSFEKPSATSREKVTVINNDIWYDISAMFFPYLIAIMLFIISISSFFISRSGEEKLNVIVGAILMALIFLGFGHLYKAIIVIIIPLFEQHIWINYIINISIQIVFCVITAYFIMKSQKKASLHS